MRKPSSPYDVIIAGAGPVGLSLAIDLGRRGVTCLILERNPTTARRMHGMRGAEFGYTYAGSAIVADEPDNPPEWDANTYAPHTRPGVRVPHMWLRDGRALQDVIGDGYTLLDLRGDADLAGLEAAFRSAGAPLEVLRLDEAHIREVYGKSIFLLRPDLHVAWRSDTPPDNPWNLCAALPAKAIGRRPQGRQTRRPAGPSAPSKNNPPNLGKQRA